MRDPIVILSPHLGDAVLSLGAAIHAWSSSGERVRVLTVLAGDPTSGEPAGEWDRAAGFHTEGEAARGRREEDMRACAIVGAESTWLPFGDVQYDRHAGDAEIADAVRGAIGAARLVLMPGCPTTHADHLWLTTTMLEHGIGGDLYLEQPYAMRRRLPRVRVVTPPAIASLGGPTAWRSIDVSDADRDAKARAVQAYASQVPLLGEGRVRFRMPLYERFIGGERTTAALRRGRLVRVGGVA